MVIVACNKTGERRLLQCSGHAGYNPGNDIVCAAVSALCGALVATLLKHQDEFMSFFYEEDSGECRVVCVGEAAAPYFECVFVGMEKLGLEFPGNVLILGSYEGEKTE